MIIETFKLDHMEKSNTGKRSTGLFRALNQQTRTEWFQLAGAFKEKEGQQYYSHDARVLFREVKSRRLFRLQRDGRRLSPDPESGEAF